MRNNKKILTAMLMLLLAALACNIGSFNLQGGQVTFDIRISEEQLNAGDFQINIADLFSGSYKVDLQPGIMVISGELVRPNGSQVSGQAEVAVRAVDGQLQVEIVAVDAEGIDINDSRIQNLQQTIQENLSRAFEGQNFVSIDAVEITDDEIIFTVRGSISGSSGS